ncbi:hypothetical protein FRC02_009669 [Tulasnella sp. 418]|nr:hypothetical protein FRC02_009669 [Tulasnella sp. 418]
MASPQGQPIDAFYYPAHEVQRPTHPRIHIRSAEDAHVLFEAVRLGVLRPVIRRLNDGERSLYIRSGSVFVWEESEEAIGLRRWTDGLVWSASRCRDPFLFYEARSKSSGGQTPNERDHSSSEALNTSYNADASTSRCNTDQGIPGLVKQTYSALVVGAGTRRQKLHLTAYFTHADYASLPTVQEDSVLRSIAVPRGMYRSGKSRQSAKSLQEWAEAASTEQGASTSNYETSSSASASPNMGHQSQVSPAVSPHSRPSSSNRKLQNQGTYLPSPTAMHPHSPTSSRHSHPSQYPPSAQAMHYDPRIHGQLSPTTLPPLQSGLAETRFTTSPMGGMRPMVRAAEDERMLQLLGSRP